MAGPCVDVLWDAGYNLKWVFCPVVPTETLPFVARSAIHPADAFPIRRAA